jgi:hypothetical protein
VKTPSVVSVEIPTNPSISKSSSSSKSDSRSSSGLSDAFSLAAILIFLDAYFELGLIFLLEPCWSGISEDGPDVRTGATDRRVRRRRCWLVRILRSWSVIPAPVWLVCILEDGRLVERGTYRHEGN